MAKKLELYDDVIDTVTGKKATIVYVSDEEIDDCYLIEPVDNSYDPDWRYAHQLDKSIS
ncbi:TPA: hypothetical protein ACGO11_000541 [Streptococcus suis]